MRECEENRKKKEGEGGQEGGRKGVDSEEGSEGEICIEGEVGVVREEGSR